MTRSTNSIAALWCVALCLAATACSCTSWGLQRAPGPDVYRDARFPDVVAPVSFKLADSELTFNVGPKHRDLILCFEGKMPAPELVRFVQDRYSVGNWSFEYSQTLGDRTFMDFRKGNERCSVLIEQRRFKTVLTIRVHEIPE